MPAPARFLPRRPLEPCTKTHSGLLDYGHALQSRSACDTSHDAGCRLCRRARTGQSGVGATTHTGCHIQTAGKRARILVIGASGTLGSAVSLALSAQHNVIRASLSKSPVVVDITSLDTITALYMTVGKVDAVVCAAGHAVFRPLTMLTNVTQAYVRAVAGRMTGEILDVPPI